MSNTVFPTEHAIASLCLSISKEKFDAYYADFRKQKASHEEAIKLAHAKCAVKAGKRALKDAKKQARNEHSEAFRAAQAFLSGRAG